MITVFVTEKLIINFLTKNFICIRYKACSSSQSLTVIYIFYLFKKIVFNAKSGKFGQKCKVSIDLSLENSSS